MESGIWTGKKLGKYEIGELVGQGGMAQVYKGYHPALKRDVAVKLIHSYLVDGEGFIQRFQREAQLVAALRHPNIVQVFDLDTDQGVYYMVMEFIDGQTLASRLQQLQNVNGLMPLDQVVDLILTLCNALDYAHTQGMIHRDVKPGNVMFTSKGQPVLTDFGLAKIVGAGASVVSGVVVGTPMYMSPEQALGDSGDARSDIYALGVTLFELSTGTAPFAHNTPMSIVFKQINEPLPSARETNPRVPEAIENVIVKATAKKPQDRYQSCREFAAALKSQPSAVPAIFGLNAPPTPPPLPVPSQSAPTQAMAVRKTISLDVLRSIFIQVLGPVGRIMEVSRIASAMREDPKAFPLDRLDELLERAAKQYHLTDLEKRNQIRQRAYETFRKKE